MATTDIDNPRGQAWVWYKENVLRRLKFVFMGFGGFGAFGHMGRDLIEGLEWWVSIVDVYHNWFGVPAAAILKWALQAPIIWIASLFNFDLIPPDFPVWGVDIIVLANIAAGFLVFKKYLTIPAQFFVSLTIVLSLSIFLYSFSIFEVFGLVGVLFGAIIGLYFVWISFLFQIEIAASAIDLVWYYDTYETPPGRQSLVKSFRIYIRRLMQRPFDSRFDQDMSNFMRPAIAYWQAALTYSTILGLGAMVLLLNQYADVALPPIERLSIAWDSMIQDLMGWAEGDR